jgi:YVTN family beta-propeller protein
VAITPDGGQALMLAAGSNEVFVLSISPTGVLSDSGQRVTLAGTELNGGRTIAITPNGQLALVTDIFNDVVNVLTREGTSWSLAGSIAGLGNAPSGVAITPDGTKAYVSSFGDNLVSVLTISENSVSDSGTRITVAAGTPDTFFGVPGIAVTPDGARLLISSFASDVISMIDTATDTLLEQTIPVGDSPAGIGMPPP